MPIRKQTLAQARDLRKKVRWTEKLLWRYLRNRKLSGCKFRRQQPIDRYILDFYSPEKRLAIEIDGREHGEPDSMAHDKKREIYLRQQGIRVLRFWNFQLRENLEGVLERIRIEAERPEEVFPSPQPSPAQRGEGED